MENKPKFSQAVFGGGCFWCFEAIFSRLKGIVKVTSGYAGGNPPAGGKKPTYEEICSGKTGHAEVVKIEFNREKISFEDLLTVFFAMHDPTTKNRQGADIGDQYRSIILITDNTQKGKTEKFIKKLSEDKIFENPIVTEIKKFEDFYPAENYHQDYFANNPRQPYCQINISPKIEKLQKKFEALTK